MDKVTAATNSQKDSYSDVCIIGAGVAGITLASELSALDCSITLLDAGSVGYSIEQQETYKAELLPAHFPDSRYSRLKMLGGSSNHWENNTSPFTALDFEYRDWIPHSGWPIKLRDLEEYYTLAGNYCGVGNDGYDSKKWLALLNHINIVKNSSRLLVGTAKSSTPPVRFYDAYGASLKSSDNLKVIEDQTLTDIDFNSNQGIIRSVTSMNSKGETAMHRAKTFVMCLGGIENARLLLLANAKYDNAIGNQGDCVGRYFMEHPTPRAAHLLTDNKNTISEFMKRHNLGDKDVHFFITLSDECVQTNKPPISESPFHQLQSMSYLMRFLHFI